MCRVLAYLGDPIDLSHVLFETDSSLVAQTHSPKMTAGMLNLAGFGMVAWDERSVKPEDPFVYRTTTLPEFDRNLRALSGKLAPTCLIAHVRGVADGGQDVVATTNLHPFRFPGARVVLAHNGHLRGFSDMRYDLLERIKPEVQRWIEGTTDSEWIYALVLSQLEDPFGLPETDELTRAVGSALRILREVRARHRIDVSSPVNLFLTTGRELIVTRFSFDYGWYPEDDPYLEPDLPYASLWFTLGGEYTSGPNGYEMGACDKPRAVLLASEPLTVDISTWLEVPEYSMITAESTPEGIAFDTRDLDA